MKKIYIKFNYQYGKADYEEEAMMYGAKYNILIIDNVKQVISKDGVLYVTYKDTPRSKQSRYINFYTKDLKEVTTN